MKERREASPYRVVGERGEWFAWNPRGRLDPWRPHVCRITHFQRRRSVQVTAVFGRTPFEALERLKRIEGKAS